MIISSEGEKKKNSEANFNLMISYIIMMMTIHRNNCVEKVLGGGVSHLCRRLYKTKKKKGVCRFFCKEKKQKNCYVCKREKGNTKQVGSTFTIYIYECCWLREDGVPLFSLSLSLVGVPVFQCFWRCLRESQSFNSAGSSRVGSR